MLTRRHFVVTASALFSAPVAWAQTAVEPAAAEVVEAPVEPEVETPPAPAPRAPRSNPANWDRWDAKITPPNYDPFTSNPWGFHPRFLPQIVEANPGLRVGDIHVDAVARYLYHIREGGVAMRYGVAIAKGNLYEPGTYRIGRKAKWPSWYTENGRLGSSRGAMAQRSPRRRLTRCPATMVTE